MMSNMADEVDVVDIEGDENDGTLSDFAGDGGGDGGILQDQYLQSAWKNNSSVLPWTLDSSISAENREVIENMLLEEQYYLTGKAAPKTAWTNEKPKAKKSPVKTSAPPARWAQEEKELFEKGLAQYGRRWTKIAKLIGSRTVLQVKSYARQYFRNKAKSEPPPPASSNKPPDLQPTTPQKLVKNHITALTNAVRIETLSDDEDVDITDDLSDEGSQTDQPPEMGGGQEGVEEQDSQGEASHSPQSPPTPPSPKASPPRLAEASAYGGTLEVDSGPSSAVQFDPSVSEEEGKTDLESASLGRTPQEEEEKHYDTDEEDQEEEEDDEIRAPEQEVTLDKDEITEEEKQAIPEFFEGRPAKTPERYLKIRNHILEQWEKCKPKYLNKTSVRPGLKNCGDVNCIGRVHTYLELIGAVNFNCDQAIYNRPRPADRSRLKEGKDTLEAYQLAHRLQSMRTRKRRVRDVWGNWCDAKDLEGQTYEHLSAEELALRREELKKHPRPFKQARLKGSIDPFQLIPCKPFGEDKQEPFQVIVSAEALVVMDMHAHVSMAEVIGLLGGAYLEEEKVLKISAAEPCNSLSTGMQCEMDPVSQTQASERLAAKGLSVVGWYHSHPAFDPNPSVRDIDTQAKYQSYFSRGGAPFIGMIVSPYNPSNPSPVSQTTCLVVSEEEGPSGTQKLPYRFELQQCSERPDWKEVMRRAEWVVQKYRQTHGAVPLERIFRRDSQLTCLEKMLASMKTYLELLPDVEVNTFLVQIETLFVTQFTSGTEGTDGGEDGGGSAVFLDEPVMLDHGYTLASPRRVNDNEMSDTQEVYTEEESSPKPTDFDSQCNTGTS
ncbi:histone H2A deubiquitinase MYSM1 [Clupea harengus]|uniref:Myb-like, SWIRM and MPN domain-containing protein 1 n=1 Tax=Clupea harengus TaxID=7950 RepID=A0A6P3W8Q4_CLUHA|nr:histone H2A deubiquitinase MYSM1 [Clupea harengus]